MLDIALAAGAPKRALEGGQRGASSEDMLARAQACMSLAGVTRLADVTGLDDIGLPVVVAVRPASRSVAISQGKGLTLTSAKVSALMESLEGWHAERLTLPQRVESRRELVKSDVAMRLDHPFVQAVADIDDDAPIVWAQGLDLLDREPCWAPWDLVTLNMVQAAGTGLAFLRSSNGLASGGSLLEALVHSLCELIERDAVARWSRLNEVAVKATQVDLNTIADPILRSVLDKIDAAGAVTGLWDITSDLGVPCYAVQIVDDDARTSARTVGAFSGFGAHLNREVAALRALTEAVQSRLSIVSGSRDDLDYKEYDRCRRPDAMKSLLNAIRHPAAQVAFGSRASADQADFALDLEAILSRLRDRRDGPVIAFDLSRSDVGLAVVRVVAPGLEHMPDWSEAPRRAAMEPELAR